jgi:hypothetical protein
MALVVGCSATAALADAHNPAELSIGQLAPAQAAVK